MKIGKRSGRLSDGDECTKYRIDFALILLTGNLTRYLMTRPIVAADPSVKARWYPIRTWIPDDILRFLPGSWRVRLRHFLDSAHLYFRRPGDAIIIHAFETYYIYALIHRFLHRQEIIIKNPDGPIASPSWSLRGMLRRLAVDSTDLIVPWSAWAGRQIMASYPWIPRSRYLVIHPGLDLCRWPFRGVKSPRERFRVTFIAGNLLIKGAETLLDAFDEELNKHCDLEIATQSNYLTEQLKSRILSMPNVYLHLDLPANSDSLREIYRRGDVFVSASNQDTSSWVALEAMATGLPVVMTPIGGIPEIVLDGETGLLIPPRDPQALREAVERLRMDDDLRKRIIVQARRHIEESFDARVNTARLLTAAKELIDLRH